MALAVLLPLPALAGLVKLETKTGLRGVYFLPDPSSKQIRVQTFVLAGEADFDGPEGLSHYLEHIMYWHANRLDEQPYHGRQGNAWVNGLVTTYFNIGSRAELDDMFAFAARLLSEPTLDEQFMLDERKVVLREYDLRVSENPSWRAWADVWPRLLPDNPVARSVIGTPESIASMTLDHARSFHRKYYHPANIILLVTGPMSEQEVVRRVEETFGGFPAGEAYEQMWRRQVPTAVVDETVVLKDRYVAFPSATRGMVANWKGRSDRPQNMAIMDILDSIMSSALMGSIAVPLRIDGFYFSSYNIDIWSVLDGQAMVYFEGRLDDDIDATQALAALDAALAKVAEDGMPESTIERVRRRIIQSAERRAGEGEYVVNRLALAASHGFEPESVSRYVERIKAVTKADIDGLLKAIVAAERRVSVHFIPLEE